MAEVSISELRRNLSRYLDGVRDGDEIIVTRRGTAMAQILPNLRVEPTTGW